MATEGPGEEPAAAAPLPELGVAGGCARTGVLNLTRTGSAWCTWGCFWAGSRNAMMIVLFSYGFAEFLLLVLGKTEGVLSQQI